MTTDELVEQFLGRGGRVDRVPAELPRHIAVERGPFWEAKRREFREQHGPSPRRPPHIRTQDRRFTRTEIRSAD